MKDPDAEGPLIAPSIDDGEDDAPIPSIDKTAGPPSEDVEVGVESEEGGKVRLGFSEALEGIKLDPEDAKALGGALLNHARHAQE